MKMHELLAVEGTLKGQAEKTRGDLKNTFEKKRHLFTEKVVTFQPTEEGAAAVREEQLDLQTTVGKELDWIGAILGRAMDASFQVANANIRAASDIVLDDGTMVAAGVPATALLELEKRMNEIHDLVSAVPTLDPAKGFIPDAQRGAGIYIAREERKTRGRKVQKPLVLYPATPEHPAQTQLITEDVVIGTIIHQEWSGLITTAQKGDMLDRVEALRRAVKQARARANEAVVDTGKVIGESIFSYVLKGTLSGKTQAQG